MIFFRKILFPVSLVYAFVTYLRNFFYDKGVFKSFSSKIPTIVVGNLSVGGTGKTPQTEYLISLLKSKYHIAVLSRGYKRKSKGYLLAQPESGADILGDEPFQLYKKFKNLIVAVDEKRVRGLEQLSLMNPPIDVVILDDAFQHRSVKGGINILLTSYNQLYVDDYLLPSGNLRESAKESKRADIIVVTKCPEGLQKEEMNQITTKLNPLDSQSVFYSKIQYSNKLKGADQIEIEHLKQYKVLLITGIANPAPLTNYLSEKNIDYQHLKFPDHHDFKEKELIEIKRRFESFESSNKLILTTEKDYVRLGKRLDKLYYIEIETKFVEKATKFDKKIKQYVEQSSRNR